VKTIPDRTAVPPHAIRSSREWAPLTTRNRNSTELLLARATAGPRPGLGWGGRSSPDPHRRTTARRRDDRHTAKRTERGETRLNPTRPAVSVTAAHGQEAKERGELMMGVHRDRRGVLERVRQPFTDDASPRGGGPLSPSGPLDDLLGVVPARARLAMKTAWKSREHRDRDQVTDEEVRSRKARGERREEDRQEEM